MNNLDPNHYMHYILNGHNPEDYEENLAEDRLYDEIQKAAFYIARTKVDNSDLELDIDDVDVDVDSKTARVMMSNVAGTIEVQLDYDHETGDYEVTEL